MELLGSTWLKIVENKNSENVSNLEITEGVLVDWIVINNDYQQDARVLYGFLPNKSFSQLLELLPKRFTFLKKINSDSHILKYGLLVEMLSC